MSRNKRRAFLIGGVTIVVIAAFGFYMIPKAAAATGCFPDTVGHWAEEFICWLVNNGIVGGYPDGTYRPGNNVTRAELSVFISNLTEATSNDGTQPYIFNISHTAMGSPEPDAFIASSYDGDGVQGISTGVGVANYGVYGRTNSTDSYESGVFGDNTGNGAGVYGHGNYANTGYGVRAASADAHAVYGDANSTDYDDYGGYFRGPQGVYATSELGSTDAITARCTAGGACWGLDTHSDTSYGIYASTGVASNNYGLYTPDNIYANSYLATSGFSTIAKNGGSGNLDVGDVVVVSGMADPIPDSNVPLLVVELADGKSLNNVVGVVETAFRIEMVSHPEVIFHETEIADPEGGEPDRVWLPETVDRMVPIHEAVSGAVKPGGLMMIRLLGMAQVKVDASAGAISAGDPLVLAPSTGYLMSAEASPEGPTTGTTIIGVALEAKSAGTGLIWVLVNPH